MTLTHVNREAVDDRLARLRGEYPAFPVLAERSSIPVESFESLHGEAVDGYAGAGYAWVVRHPADAPALSESMPADAAEDRPHVLLILDRGTDGAPWDIPGGGREAGETYEEATVRELREETGIDVDLGDPFLALRSRYTVETGGDGGDGDDGDVEDGEDDGDAPAEYHDVCLHALWVCFDATYAGGSIAIQAGELRGAAWFADRPADLAPWAEYRAAEWWGDDPIDDPWWTDYDEL